MLEKCDNELTFWALSMWANYIESEQLHVGAEDLKRMGETPKELEPEQKALAARLRNLAMQAMQRVGTPAAPHPIQWIPGPDDFGPVTCQAD